MGVLLTALAVGGLSGCGARNGAPRTYGHDGYMGLSNSNPNIPGNPNYFNYNSDVEFMEEKLMELGGIRDARFRVLDPHIYVTIYPDQGLSGDRAAELEALAQSTLQSNMPRYTIHVELGR
ncbi:hypothetical protein AB6A23_26905 [Paenibacillus tarimensis]